MVATDEELVARSMNGDVDSFNQLVLRWERPIYALAYRVIGRDEDARDVAQETFLRAFRALPGFKGQAKFSSWIYRIALNLCRDWIRRKKRQPLVEMPEGVDIAARVSKHTQLVHLFTKEKAELAGSLEAWLKVLSADAVIWVSWPKKTSKVPTDITEDTIRAVALPMGLVDIKVCAVDETWSGLKLVLRKELR